MASAGYCPGTIVAEAGEGRLDAWIAGLSGLIAGAMLFGLLYQGGSELSFAKPEINRDMVVVIQGLVILFMGALEYAFRPWLAALRRGGLGSRAVGN